MATRREILDAAMDAVADGGAMTFRTFMELALYHPEGGYYTRPTMRVGAGGDFHTSPTIHEAFGQCLARQLVQLWERLGKPEDLCLLEMGAGSGQLADQILNELAAMRGRWKHVRFAILERSAALRERQQALLAPHGDAVQWVDSLSALAPEGKWEGIILSNELFDAFPVHRVIGLKEGFAEIGVMRGENGRWRQVGVEPTTPRLEETLSRLGITLQEGQQAEINLDAQDWMETLGSWLGRGFVLTVDYGSEAERVYAPHRHKGTIRGFFKQMAIDDPLSHPGEQDLTSDVDFTSLIAAGEKVGLRTLGVVPQGLFLKHLGIEEIEKKLLKGLKNALAVDFAAYEIRKLYQPDAMGERFLVLIQAKGVDTKPADVAGLGGKPLASGWRKLLSWR
ncbi:SAM-dependent methyltransferase [bacterium]|nr:SAM-dependent methyltransferase [bacterium]